MIELGVDSIKDFQTCALYFDYKHQKSMYTPINGREVLLLRFENTLKKLLSFYFYKRQGGITPSLGALLNRWEKLWFPKDMSSYDIAINRHEIMNINLDSLNTTAVDAIMQFYNLFADDNRDPILIDETFLVPIGQEIRLHGSFDLILRTPGTKKIDIIKWLLRPKRPNISMLNIDFAAQKYAYEFKTDASDLSITYHALDVMSLSTGRFKIEVTEDDVNSLLYWAQQAHETPLYVPRRGLTAYCKGCPFDSPCSDYSITESILYLKNSEQKSNAR